VFFSVHARAHTHTILFALCACGEWLNLISVENLLERLRIGATSSTVGGVFHASRFQEGGIS
jgi:hypothetical protein